MITVVTSFTDAIYERNGRKFVESFRKFWPSDVKLVCYYEGDKLREDWHWIEEVHGWQDFEDSIKKFPLMCGNMNGRYEINFDARMARKAFIQMHAAKLYGGKVIWIDCDSIFHAPVTHEFLSMVLPDDKLCCYLGRDGWFFTESGFIGFNAEHEYFQEFARVYLEVFNSGLVFTQKLPDGRCIWHDCAGFDLARRTFGEIGRECMVNLADGLPFETMHPLINSVLGSVMDHMKGPRKDRKSSPEDLVVERKEPYWNDNKPQASQASERIMLPGTDTQPVSRRAEPLILPAA